MLYHATRQRFIGSIKKEGLHATNTKSFDGQIGDGLVYFAFDNDVAGDFAECADNIPESWYDDNIIVLAVDEKNLNKDMFEKDPNIIDGDDISIAYRGSIPPDMLGVIDYKNKKIEPLLNVKKLSNRFYYGGYGIYHDNDSTMEDYEER